MNITNLQSGLVINNYKELCKLLEILPKEGNSKAAQLKEMERYFSYRKEGIKFHIEEIYSEPLPENNNITTYIPLIQKMLLHFIIKSQDESNRIYIRKNQLMNLLGMINEEYAMYKYKQLTLQRRLKVSKQSIIDFYSSSSSMLKRNLESALNSLQNQSLIQWKNVFTVAKVTKTNDNGKLVRTKRIDSDGNECYEYAVQSEIEFCIREATVEETELILHEQRSLLLKFGMEGLDEVYSSGRSSAFFDEVKNRLLETNNIGDFYESFSLVFNREFVEKQYEVLDNFVLDSDTEYQLSLLLNGEIVKKHKVLAENRQKEVVKVTDKKVKKERSKKKYIADSNLLTKSLIKIK